MSWGPACQFSELRQKSWTSEVAGTSASGVSIAGVLGLPSSGWPKQALRTRMRRVRRCRFARVCAHIVVADRMRLTLIWTRGLCRPEAHEPHHLSTLIKMRKHKLDKCSNNDRGGILGASSGVGHKLRPKSANLRATLTNTGPSCGRIRPTLARCWSNLVNSWPKLAEFGARRPEIALKLPP